MFSKCFASAVRDQISLPKLCCSTDVKSFLSSLANFPNRFISADVSDFYAERLIIGSNAAIPKLLGFHAVANNISKLVDFDLAV
mgnify:CR=1 FL=1